MKRVLVYIDEDAVEDSLQLLEVGRLMYGAAGFWTYALAAGGRSGEAGRRFDCVFRVSQGALPNYETAALARCIEALQRTYGFDAILFPATHCGRMLAPRAAARLRAGLVADVTGVGRDGDGLWLARPAFGGRRLATIVCRGDGPVMLSVRPRVFTAGPPVRKSAEYIEIEAPDPPAPGVRLIERREKPPARDIRDSAVLIAGGGGVLDDFPLLERLAQALHGMVAASRKAVDLGKAPRANQVGQSGKTVSPRLYIAIGISGSAPHLAGLRNAEYVLAVNPDRHAPICSLADVVVEGDGREFVERLLERLDAARTQTHGGQG